MSSYPWQGIRLKIHPLFWLITCSSVWTGYFIEVITLFVLVIIHELGHVTAAWSYGWRIHSMEILPFGGVAKTEEWGTVPAREEIVVALAGPFHHVFIILMSLCFNMSGLWSEAWTQYFIWVNVLIAGFNLLPIYPLDGGRVLQSYLSYFFPYRTCMFYTLGLSLFLSLLLVCAAFLIPGNFVHLPLLCISLFLIFSNVTLMRKLDYQYLRFLIRRRDKGISHNVAIKTIRVKIDDSLWKIMKGWYKEKYHVFEVRDKQGRVIGFLPEEKILERYFNESNPYCMVRELIS